MKSINSWVNQNKKNVENIINMFMATYAIGFEIHIVDPQHKTKALMMKKKLS